MDPELSPSPSRRLPAIDLLRVIAIFFVMLIHSGTPRESIGSYLLKDFIAAGAVPAFFIMSGYLGARKIISSTDYWLYAREKWRSLIIPYIFWSIPCLFIVLVLKNTSFGHTFHGNGNYFNVDLNFNSIVSAVFGLDRMPIVYQFWFLRDLIAASLTGYFIFRALPDVRLLGFLFLLIPLPVFPSLGYFLLGNQLYRIRNTAFPTGRREASMYCVLWLAFGIISHALGVSAPHLLVTLGGAAFLYFMANLLCISRVNKYLTHLGPATFFVYALHEPTQTILFKTWKILNLPGFDSLLLFVLIPILVFATCVATYTILRIFFPKTMKMATGNR